MMAIMTTTFKTPGRKIPYGWVIERLEQLYSDVMSEGLLEYDTSLRLWILISVTFTVTEEKPAWVKKAWRETDPGMTWETVKAHLMRVMFIEMVSNSRAEEMFNKLEALR
jgi:hypothetical protein